MSKSKITIVLMAFGFASAVVAQEDRPFVLKMAERVSNGDCLPPSSEDPEAVLKRNDVQIQGKAKAEEKKALARAILAIERAGAGTFHAHHGARFVYRTGHVRSRFNGKAIEINPGRQNVHALRDKSLGGTNNVGLHAHELGHFVGGQGLYAKYFAAVPKDKRCLVSKYAESRRNEEFAEAFAAYLLDPERLSHGGEGCERARNFFSEIFGAKKDSIRDCTGAAGPHSG